MKCLYYFAYKFNGGTAIIGHIFYGNNDRCECGVEAW